MNKPLKILFIGCVEFSGKLFDQVSAHPKAQICGVVTRASSKFNSDFESLSSRAQALDAPCFETDVSSSAQLTDWIRARDADVIFCFGWSYLLPTEILEIPPFGCVGYHPAELPHNRGRHPIIWALALGLERTASTFLQLTEEADAGPILSQVPVSITDEDTAATLYSKLNEVALKQVDKLITELHSGTAEALEQDHAVANNWRKRGVRDGLIDWRMSAQAIYNLIRALTRPYVGAHCSFQGCDTIIWRAEWRASEEHNNAEPGKVIRVSGSRFEVKCGDGILLVLEHDFSEIPSEGSYL